MNPVRSLIAGFLCIALLIWAGWVLVANEPCERVYRLGEPVRQLMKGVRTVADNWVDQSDKDSMLVAQYQADAALQKFLQRQFYNDLSCVKGH